VEEALRRSEEPFGQMVDTIGAAFWSSAADSMSIHYASPAF